MVKLCVRESEDRKRFMFDFTRYGVYFEGPCCSANGDYFVHNE